MINVTKVHLPPLADYVKLLEGIWERAHLTNNGPLLVELERQLRIALDVPYVFVVTNGMLALHIAIRALALKGAVITTPFSYVATTAAAVWEGLDPVFADVDDRLCLDPESAARVWRDDVSAILATHVYGNACDVDALQALADARGVPIIYDAAHTFGARLRGRALADYGAIGTLSFHATKLFHTGEGGALVTRDPALAERIEWLRNFGHASPETFHGCGTNAKMSELHAAMGLVVLPKVAELIEARRERVAIYDAELAGLPLTQPRWAEGLERNHAYYPLLFDDEAALLRVRSALNTENVFPRRYFYPTLSQLDYVPPQATPRADDIAKRVLCLPLWPELDVMQVYRIASLVRRGL